MSTPSSPSQPGSNPASLFSAKSGPKPSTIGYINKKTFRYTIILGIVAGLAFSLALWGYEAILFIRAYVAFPWLPLLLGMILCSLICTLAALLTWLVNRALLGIIFWILAARAISELAIYLPLKIAPALMLFLEPGLRSKLPSYPINSTFQTWAGIGTVWLAIFLGIMGLLQLTLVEQSVPATTSAGRLTAYLIFIPVMVLASVLSSNMINEQLRAPLIETNTLIQFYAEHQNVKVDPTVARAMRMSTIADISDLVNRPRRLFLGQYDDYYGQVDVLIDFSGEWADCSTVYAQVVSCQSISNP